MWFLLSCISSTRNKQADITWIIYLLYITVTYMYIISHKIIESLIFFLFYDIYFIILCLIFKKIYSSLKSRVIATYIYFVKNNNPCDTKKQTSIIHREFPHFSYYTFFSQVRCMMEVHYLLALSQGTLCVNNLPRPLS